MDVRSNLKVLSLGEPVQISHEERIITGGIDAGGSQAISQLRILEHLMEQISESNEGIVKRPCEVFDVIGGVGTGGWVQPSLAITFGYLHMRFSLIAIFLVIFKMTVKEALEEFIKFIAEVYKDPDQDPRKQTRRLEGALEGILERHKIDKETKLIQADEPTPTCKL
jgi:hypothetical protein